MTTRLAYTNIQEMTMEIPAMSLSKSNRMEKEQFVIANKYAEASFQTVRTPLYSIIDARMRSHDDLQVYSHTEANDYIWFCAALQGDITAVCSKGSEESWRSGQANILTYDDVKGSTCFIKEKPFRMIEIMLLPEYLEQIAVASPGLFDEILAQHSCKQFVRVADEHLRFCHQTGKALKELLNYESVGNLAPMYLDAKIREILALFLCRKEQKDCLSCHCYSPKDDDLFLHVKAIIEREYLNPPSLRSLALMVGTNECKLKNGFKNRFGATVFGYLFDYRMEIACRYLSDTDKSIQEIADLTGYEHHSHFSTAFKRKFCVSPQEYRKNKKG